MRSVIFILFMVLTSSFFLHTVQAMEAKGDFQKIRALLHEGSAAEAHVMLENWQHEKDEHWRLHSAFALHALQRFKDALDILHPISSEFPQFDRVQLLQLQLHIQLQHWDSVLIFAALIDEPALTAEWSYGLIYAAGQLQRFDLQAQLLRTARLRWPEDGELLRLAYLHYREIGDEVQVRASLQEWSKQRPADAAIYQLMAQHAVDQAHRLRFLAFAALLEPDDESLARSCAQAYLDAELPKQALLHLQRIGQTRWSTSDHALAAWCFELLDDLAQAQHHAQHVDDAQLGVPLQLRLALIRNDFAAVAALAKQMLQQPVPNVMLLIRAAHLFAERDVVLAEAWYRQALELDREQAELYVAAFLLRNQQHAEAKDILDQRLQRNPGDGWALRLRNSIPK